MHMSFLSKKKNLCISNNNPPVFLRYSLGLENNPEYPLVEQVKDEHLNMAV